MVEFKPKGLYSFSVYPTAVLGTGFENVTVLAILDQETANAFTETRSKHIQVYPYLPAGTPNDPAAYNYLRVRRASGEIEIIGQAWIIPESVVLVNLQTITVRIANMAMDDVPKLREILAANGYKAVDISVSSEPVIEV
jgi:hypothetical protein